MGRLAEWREADWAPVSASGFGLVAAIAAGLAVFYSNSRDDFLPLLDHVNLAFHEAGHIFFGVFGKWTGILGGTLGQFVFPLAVMLAFWRKGQTVSYAIAATWLFQNFFYTARYVADARARQLPLVGGGDHDWTNLLFHWDMLHQDLVIAGGLQNLGWLGIISVVGWTAWHAFLRENRR